MPLAFEMPRFFLVGPVGGGACCLDGIGGCTELMGRYMGYRHGLTSRKRSLRSRGMTLPTGV